MKKKLIMILCAVVSLSLSACGGTVETDSDSRTERESKKSESKTIIDKLSLYDSTLSDVEDYLNDRSIIYNYGADEIYTQISEDFLGYDCTYSLNFFKETAISDKDDNILYTLNTPEDFLQYYYYADKLRERFPDMKPLVMGFVDGDELYNLTEKTTGDEILSNIVIRIGFTNDEEFVEGGKEIKNYLQGKANTVSDIEVHWDTERDITYFPINSVKIDGVDCIEYVSFEKRYYEEGEGYCGSTYRLGYCLLPKELWDSEIINYGVVTEVEAVTEEATAADIPSEATEVEVTTSDSDSADSSTATKTKILDSSTTSQVESERKGFFPRSDIDYQALSDKFAGFYVPLNGGDDCFEISEYDEESVAYSQENGTAYTFMAQYRADWWDYADIVSYDGTSVGLSFGEEYGVVKLIYIDENTVSYRGRKYTRYVEDSQTLQDIDVESEVSTIRDYYYTTQNNLGNYMIEEHPEITMYHEAGYPVKIVIKSGYNDWGYTREYYYHDQELYFAYVYNGSEQHRLYFKDDSLIRYIDENSNTYDYGNLGSYSEWANKILSESNNEYPTMPNCGA